MRGPISKNQPSPIHGPTYISRAPRHLLLAQSHFHPSPNSRQIAAAAPRPSLFPGALPPHGQPREPPPVLRLHALSSLLHESMSFLPHGPSPLRYDVPRAAAHLPATMIEASTACLQAPYTDALMCVDWNDLCWFGMCLDIFLCTSVTESSADLGIFFLCVRWKYSG